MLVVMSIVVRTVIYDLFKFIGNTAETTLNQFNCSVFVVKPMRFEAPITLFTVLWSKKTSQNREVIKSSLLSVAPTFRTPLPISRI